MAVNARPVPPSTYAAYEAKWPSLPDDEAGWIQRAKDVAAVLAQDVIEREKRGASPLAEVTLLKHSGLLKMLGPKEYGGGQQPWSVAYRAIRELAQGDGSLGMLLGYHLLWSTTANIVGTVAQAARFNERIISGNLFVGGAVNPRDNDLRITSDHDVLVFDGFKHFTTGGYVADLLVLEGTYEDGNHIFAMVETNQPAIDFACNWDNVGLRLTESGSVRINGARAPWADALGWDADSKKMDPAVLGIPYATMLLPTVQLVFSNFYIGIAWGALNTAAAYTKTSTRAWPYGGDNKDSPTDEFYILSTYGNFLAHLRAATALADQAAQHLDAIYAKGGHDSLAQRATVTAQDRGEVSESIASVKVVATDTSLRVTAGIFEVTGAKSTATKYGLDRFWRDLRTHTLHDPVAYKNRELGRYLLLGELPEPTWYT